MINQRRNIQLNKMKERSGETFVLEDDDFETVLTKFKSKQTKTYDFLIKAGVKYQKAIFLLCKTIIENEDFPRSFRKTTLYMIWKRKGAMDILSNNRFLHMKNILARTVDALIVNQLNEPLINKATIYQIGGLPGHSINEHLITVKTIMAWAEVKEKVIVFLIMDIMSFFDKENIFDCLETMETLNCNKKATRVWYKSIKILK